MDSILRYVGKRRCNSSLAPDFVKVLLLIGLAASTGAAAAAAPAASVTLEGTVSMQIEDDFQHGRARTRYFLVERSSNERLELQLSPEQAKKIRPNQELRVRGKRSGKMLAVDAAASSVSVLTDRTSSLVAPTLTTRRVITLIVDITDGSGTLHAVDPVCDGPQPRLADEMFGSETGRPNVDGCYRDSSYEGLAFGGKTYPGTGMDVLRVATFDPSPSLAAVCNQDLWAANADTAATAQGIDLSAYQHRMYVLPAATGCGWAGLAFLGCPPGTQPCRAWVRALEGFGEHHCGLPDALAHELGHNVGLMHARTADIDGNGNNCEYCDESDIMGYAIGTLRGINAPHRDAMGWLNPDRIVDGAAGGTFTISALGMQEAPHPQVVKIVPPEGQPYWLSYRAPIGYDVGVPNHFFNLLHVHRSMFPSDSYLVSQLADAATFVDPSLNLSVRLLSHTTDTATLEVEYGSAFSLSASSLTFGFQYVNTASSAQTITVRSVGGKALPIHSIEIVGIDPLDFMQTNDCGASLDPGASCTIQVSFKPTTVDGKGATLLVIANGGADSKFVALMGTGTGARYTSSPTSLTFGNQALFSASAAKTITLSSTGVTAVPITSISFGGKNPQQFRQTNNCGSSLARGASCAIKVTFNPSVTGLKTATLEVNAANGAGTKSTALSGTSVIAAYTAAPSSLGFGNQVLNLASSAKTVTVKNTGAAALPIKSIALRGTNAPQFTQTNNCGTALAVGASCAIKVTFKPTSTGSEVATLNLTVGGGASNKVVPLSGTGVRAAFSVSPTALSFGNVIHGTSSTAKTVKIANTGSVLLPINSINLAGTNPGQFVRTSNCPTRVAVGGSCLVSVIFRPTTTGAKSAALQVVPGGGAALKSVALSGKGT